VAAGLLPVSAAIMASVVKIACAKFGPLIWWAAHTASHRNHFVPASMRNVENTYADLSGSNSTSVALMLAAAGLVFGFHLKKRMFSSQCEEDSGLLSSPQQ
jgi:hypothetical protein